MTPDLRAGLISLRELLLEEFDMPYANHCGNRALIYAADRIDALLASSPAAPMGPSTAETLGNAAFSSKNIEVSGGPVDSPAAMSEAQQGRADLVRAAFVTVPLSEAEQQPDPDHFASPAAPGEGEQLSVDVEKLAARIIDAIPEALGMTPDPWPVDGPSPHDGQPHKAVVEILRAAAPPQGREPLREAAEAAISFLRSVDWNDHTSETDASDVRTALEAALLIGEPTP